MAPTSALSKQLFLQRYFQQNLYQAGDLRISGYAQNIHRILIKYNLLDQFENQFIKQGVFCSKDNWKKSCQTQIKLHEKTAYEARIEHDEEFTRFRKVQTDIAKPNEIWNIAKCNKNAHEKCYSVAKLLCTPYAKSLYLCEYCGRLYCDAIEHFCCVCDKTEQIRERFWSQVTNDFEIEICVYLNNLNDFEFTCALLGANLPDNFNGKIKQTLRKMFMSFLSHIYSLYLINVL